MIYKKGEDYLKVVVPISFDINMKSIYSKIKPLTSKQEFLTLVRDEVKQYILVCLDTSSDNDLYGLEDYIVNNLVEDGYAEYINK